MRVDRYMHISFYAYMPIAPIERTISGKGIIQIPNEFATAKDIYLYVDLLRPNKTEFLNYTWNPSKRFLANVTFCIGDYVLLEYAVHYQRQAFQVHASQSSQNLASLICANDNILDSFVNFAIALGFTYTKNNSISGHGGTRFVPDNIRFVCYGGTALRLSLRATEIERCDPSDAPPEPPPELPVPVPPLPPDEPVEVSDPYDPNTGDDGDTEPFPIDRPENDVPPTDACVRYRVNYRLTTPGFPNPIEASEFVYGVLRGFSRTVNPSGTINIDIIAGNMISGECVQDQLFSIVANAPPPVEFTILSVEQL